MSATPLEPPAPPIRVIESLATGFETVAERLPLVLLPLLLDLLLWVGPRLTARPAFESFYRDVWLPVIEQQPAELQEQVGSTTEQLVQLSRELGPQYLPVVNWPLGDVLLLGVPSLIARQPVAPLPFDFEPPVIEMRSLVGLLGVSMLLPMGWSVMGVLYRGMVAQQVRDNRLRLGDLMRRLPVYWLNLMGFMLVLALLALVVMVPFLMIGLVLLAFSGPVGGLAVTAGMFVVMWLAIFGSFTTHSVLLNGRWVLGAMWDSVRVVQWNLSSVTLLWMLVMGLNLGLTYLFAWAGLTTDMWFVILAMGVHAFVNTALVAATYVYFKDRYRHWSEVRQLLLERLNQPVTEHVEHDARQGR